MALLMLDSFDTYSTAQLMQKWTQLAAGPYISPTIGAFGRYGTQGLRWSTDYHGFEGVCKTLLVTLPATSPLCIVGFAFTHGGGGFNGLDTGTDPNPNLFDSNTPILLCVRATSANKVWLRPNTNGTVSVYNGASTLLGTSNVGLQVGVTAYIELKTLIHASAGTVDLYFNGVNVLSLTGVVTSHSSTAVWNEIGIGHLSLNSPALTTWTYDDLYIADGSGTAWNNVKGDVQISPLYPTAQGVHTGSAPSAGADRVAGIDEPLANDDSDFNVLLAAGVKDSFVVQDLPVPGATIYGVQINMVAKRTDGGSGTLNGVAVVGGTTYVGPTPLAVPASYSGVREIMTVNPATLAPWTEAALNAAEFGYNKTT